MPTAKVFAAVAEVTGSREIAFEADTVREFLEAAAREYGPEFERLLMRCSIVLNGEQVRAVGFDVPLRDEDELAILPPVAGGQDWQTSHQ